MTTVPKFFGRRLISSVAIAAGTGQIVFNNLLPGRNYVIEWANYWGSAVSELTIQTSTDNGTTFGSAANSYATAGSYNAGTSLAATSNTTAGYGNITLGNNGTGVTAATVGQVKMLNLMNSTAYSQWISNGGGANNTNYGSWNLFAERLVLEANNAFRIIPASGTMTSGTFNLYEEFYQ